MKYFFGLTSLLCSLLATSVGAITLTLPPSDGNRDIMVTGPTQVEGNADFVMGYIQLLNKYLWFSMIILLFALLVWMGFKIMTNEAGGDEAKKVLKNGLKGAAVGIAIILFSYTIVRLVINLL